MNLSEEELEKKSQELFTGWISTDYIYFNGCRLPREYLKCADDIENFEVRDDDIWICSLPKAGTTWCQEMAWCIANDCDLETTKVSLHTRYMFLDMMHLFDMSKMPENLQKLGLIDLEQFNNAPSPRFIRTHLPFQLLPRQIRTGEKKPRLIYVTRNPKDNCISHFHHSRLLEGFLGSLDDFCQLFLAGKICFGPFWTHVFGYWEKKDCDNILFLKYEDMKADLPSVLRQTANFFGKRFTTDQVDSVVEHLSFESMKKNPALNYEDIIKGATENNISKGDGKFMRSGTVNQWKEVLSPEMIKAFEKWTDEHTKDTDFRF